MITFRQFMKKLNNKKNFNIAFINKKKYNIRICERKFKNEIKKKIESEIENNDLIKINFCLKKNKVGIKKRHNDLIFLHVFLWCRVFINSIFIFINQHRYIRFIKINNNRIFLCIFNTFNKFTILNNKYQMNKQELIYNRINFFFLRLYKRKYQNLYYRLCN